MKRLALFVILPALLSQTARAEFIFEQAYEQILTAGSTVSLDGGDFNNDGFPDFVVTCCRYYSYLFIFQGNGDCTFNLTTSVVTYSMGSITVNDFNNDGNVDLLIGEGWRDYLGYHESDVIHRFEGHGDGSFTELSALTAENIWVTADDLNGDGNDDIVISDIDAYNGEVLVKLGNGDFTFQAITGYDIPGGILHTTQILGDMNLDGNVDIGLINYCDNITFLYGNGDGTFQSATVVADQHSAAGSYGFIRIGNLNEDGMPDMAATGSMAMSSYDEVLLWDSGGGYLYSSVDSICNGGNWIEIEDFNMDGHLDIAVSSFNYGIVLSGYGNGHFANGSDSLLLKSAGATYGVLAEDFDLDGDQDLIFVGGASTCCYRNTTLTQGCTGETACGISDLTFSVSPNPFSSSVAIEVSGNHSVGASIQIFDVSGRLITELEPVSSEGVYLWDGKSSSGVEVPSGIYAVKCCSGNAVSSSMVLKLE